MNKSSLLFLILLMSPNFFQKNIEKSEHLVFKINYIGFSFEDRPNEYLVISKTDFLDNQLVLTEKKEFRKYRKKLRRQSSVHHALSYNDSTLYRIPPYDIFSFFLINNSALSIAYDFYFDKSLYVGCLKNAELQKVEEISFDFRNDSFYTGSSLTNYFQLVGVYKKFMSSDYEKIEISVLKADVDFCTFSGNTPAYFAIVKKMSNMTKVSNIEMNKIITQFSNLVDHI